MILYLIVSKNIMTIMRLALSFGNLRRRVFFLENRMKSDFVVYECFELFIDRFSW